MANSVWNLVGLGLPLLVALVSIPILIRGLGTDRFGILTLAWVVIGYFSLFDLGLGRAVTKLVADRLGAGASERVPALAWGGVALMFVVGVLGGALLAALTPWLVNEALSIPAELVPETVGAFWILALAMPIVVSTAGLRGVLEAHQRFGLVNAVRLPVGVYTFLAPLAVLPFTVELTAIAAVLCLGKLLAWLAYLAMCTRVAPASRGALRPDRRELRALLSFGGWIAVSNMVGPLLLYVDRFLIAALLSTSAVAYYSTPHEVLMRLLIVPAAILGVLFPAFSHAFAEGAHQVVPLYARARRVVLAIMVPLALLVILSARPALALWIDDDFAERSAFVAQVLAAAVVVNSAGLVAQSLVQAAGRPDLTAKLHLIEFPLYLAYLWALLGWLGIDGAAVAWLIRVSLSALVLSLLARRTLTGSLRPVEEPRS